MDNQAQIKELKRLLMDEEQRALDQLQDTVEHLNLLLEDANRTCAQTEPFIDQKLSDFQEKIPEQMGPVITETLRRQVSESQDAMVEALYPIIGKLIKKFVQREFEILSEKIDQQVNSMFSFQGIKRRVGAMFGGSSGADLIMEDMLKPVVEEVFVIEPQSGLLKGSFSKSENIEKDLIAGMLTAIMSFVEDAFQQGKQHLEVIEYETYKIIIHAYPKYNIALIVSGALTSSGKDQIEEQLLELNELYLGKIDLDDEQKVSEILHMHFSNAEEEAE